MANERLEPYLPEEFNKWYRKSPERYAPDGTFLGRDLASEKTEGSILATLGTLGMIIGAASSRLEISAIGAIFAVSHIASTLVRQDKERNKI